MLLLKEIKSNSKYLSKSSSASRSSCMRLNSTVGGVSGQSRVMSGAVEGRDVSNSAMLTGSSLSRGTTEKRQQIRTAAALSSFGACLQNSTSPVAARTEPLMSVKQLAGGVASPSDASHLLRGLVFPGQVTHLVS